MGSVEMAQDRAICGCLRRILVYGNAYFLNKFDNFSGSPPLGCLRRALKKTHDFWRKLEILEDLELLFDMSTLDVFVLPMVSLFYVNNR